MKTTVERPSLDVAKIRKDFPILHRKVRGRDLVYLDNAATSQKPRSVIEAVRRYYEEQNANIHRGVHTLSELATRAYEDTRHKAQGFLNAADVREIVFVRSATEAINLVAQAYGRAHVGAGAEILITHLEHHSNIVPWQILCEEKRARLRVAPIDDRGDVIVEEFDRLLSDRTKIVAITHLSNAIGTVVPVKRLIRAAHACGAVALVDGAQAAAHLGADVRDLDCDFYAFSGHKIYGPTGIGVLYGKLPLLEAMPPYQGGGEMILSVSFEKTIYNKAPHKFEAGTPHIEGGVALGPAIDYISDVGMDRIAAHEADLLVYGTRLLEEIPGVRIIGSARERAGAISFVMDGIHPHDVGTILDQQGIAIRTGHHCAQPVMERFDLAATARASFGMYNTREEMDVLAAGLRKVAEVFGR